MRKLLNSELKRKSIEEFHNSPKTPIIIVLDNIRSHHNVGSVFRTADAFLTQGIYLCGITGQPPHRDIQKTALGATESVEWHYFPSTLDAINELRANGYIIIGIEQVENSISLEDFDPLPDTKYAIIFGHEVFGVDQKVIDACDYTIEIPQYGTKHSFNISVSAGIVLWELNRKLSTVKKK